MQARVCVSMCVRERPRGRASRSTGGEGNSPDSMNSTRKQRGLTSWAWELCADKVLNLDQCSAIDVLQPLIIFEPESCIFFLP